MSHRIDPEGLRLPIKLDTTTIGEFAPVPLEPVHLAANRQALEDATRNARRLGMDRRSFLVNLTGAATTLLAMNRAYAQAGKSGGCYALPDAAALEEAAASEVLAGKEFIASLGEIENELAEQRRLREVNKTPPNKPRKV